MITVKAVRFPGQTQEAAIEDGSKVQDVLRALGLDATGYQIQLNGDVVSLSSSVDDGDMVVLTKAVKGNLDSITVKVVQFPGAVRELMLNGDRSLGAALTMAGVTVAAGMQVQLNGEVVTNRGTQLDDQDQVVVTKNVKGNR